MDSESDDEIPTLQDLDLDEVDEIDATTQPQNDGIRPRPRDEEHGPLPLVPVTILTGFLGSGKTTLVRHVLASPLHERRIAVIENEFGGGEGGARLAERLGLAVRDASTLSVETMIARDGTDGSNLADFIELPNGCVCCTVKDSLVETLENLLARRKDLDYILIEASGMADPGPIASVFWLDEALESRIRLDGIVTCVDAKNIRYQLESTSSDPRGCSMGDGGGDEAARQIACADRIIVNKVDLLQSHNPTDKDVTAVERVLEEIKSINPTAPIRTTTFSKIDDLDWILDANCFDVERVKDVEAAFQQSIDDARMQCMASPMYLASRNASFGLHQHTNSVRTIALFGCGSVDLHKINSWLASILWPNQDEDDKVLRARLENLLSHGIGDNNSGSSHPNISNLSKRDKQIIYRVKGVLSVGHAIDSTGNVIPSCNDWVDDGLATGEIDRKDGLDRRRFIVQAVNDLWDVLPASQNLRWQSDETRCCKVVLIGKWLEEERLQEGFRGCFNS